MLFKIIFLFTCLFSLNPGFSQDQYPVCETKSDFEGLISLTLCPLNFDPRFKIPQDISMAIKNNGDPVFRNQLITRNYKESSDALNHYLGGNDDFPNWWSFGYNASKLAGNYIKSIGETLKLIREVQNGNLINIGKNLDKIEKIIKSSGLSLKDINLMRDSLAQKNSSLKIKDYLLQIESDLENLHLGLSLGNYQIFNEVGILISHFLEMAVKNENCIVNIQQLKSNDEWKRIDPHSFLRTALDKYQQARLTNDKETKKTLIHQANLLIGFQEQFMIQKKVFDKYNLVKTFRHLRSSIKDQIGSYDLVKDNWAEFPKRMGFVSKIDHTKFMSTKEFNKEFLNKDGDLNLTPDQVIELVERGFISEYIPGTIPAFFKERINRSKREREAYFN